MNDAGSVSFRESATDLQHDGRDLGRAQTPRALQAFSEVFPIEQLHRDIRRSLPDAVIENLHDVGTPELSRSLRLALEATLRFRMVRELPFDELHGTRNIESEVRRVPNGTHSAATNETIQTKTVGDDGVGDELNGHGEFS
jgi:hypothetical protein